jgi:hypothetical protein
MFSFMIGINALVVGTAFRAIIANNAIRFEPLRSRVRFHLVVNVFDEPQGDNVNKINLSLLVP